MALYPGGLLPWIELRFLKIDGSGNLVPNASGTVETYAAGTSTPLATYADANLITSNGTTLSLASDGRPTVNVFLQPTGYKFIVKDNGATPIYTIDLVEDVGQVFAANFGTLQSAGGKNVTSGYTVLTTDKLITVSSTGGPNPCVINLPPATTFKNFLCIKNLGTVPLAITPNGTDTLDTLNTPFTMAAASSPAFPAKIMVSDGVSAWYILNIS